MEGPRLAQRISEAPTTPGVYFWRGSDGRPLYIGKATNLKSRLTSYIRTVDGRIRGMVQEALSLDWETTETDIEALILESQLIKERRPKHNLVMRDDKQYFFVAITNEDFPRIFLTHQPLKTENCELETAFIGPFTEGVPLKATLRVLRNIFPTCSCKQKHHIRCLNAHIGKCPGYCCLRQPATSVERTAYRKNVRAIRDILTGKRASVIGRIVKKDPDTALRVLRVFQNAQINARHARIAAQHHGALELMEETFRLAAPPRRIEGYDIANIQGEHRVGAMVVFTEGRADNQEYRLFNIRTGEGGDTAMLGEMFQRRLSHDDWPVPDLILVDGGKAQLNAAVKAVSSSQFSVPIVALTKDDAHRGHHVLYTVNSKLKTKNLSDLPRSVRDLILHVDAEAHRFSIKNYRRRHRRQAISM